MSSGGVYTNSYCENQGCDNAASRPEKPCAASGLRSGAVIIMAPTGPSRRFASLRDPALSMTLDPIRNLRVTE
jgi:hypothetical protein